MAKKATYKDSGVDKEAGYEAVRRFLPFAKATYDENVISGVGSFGAAYAVPPQYREPVLVSGADGVGTKLAIAQAAGAHGTVGIDLVAMCANDVAAMNAKPAFFLDYFSTGRLDPGVAAAVVEGVAEGCRQAGCALIGGETAEMPSMYEDGVYDLAGFCVGIAERREVSSPLCVKAGDAIVGFASSGAHSNGYSLIRKIFFPDGWGRLAESWEGGSLAGELLRPTKIYTGEAAFLRTLGSGLHGMCHITGGGFYENVPRMLPEGLCAKIRLSSFPRPKIFSAIAREGGVGEEEMFSTFNMGVGFMAALSPEAAKAAAEGLEGCYLIGHVAQGSGVELL
jgi:phosphoribosylformylglycinamidine cyclo-ligase